MHSVTRSKGGHYPRCDCFHEANICAILIYASNPPWPGVTSCAARRLLGNAAKDVKSEGLKKFKAGVEKAKEHSERKLNERAKLASTYALDAFAGR